jgi:transketolase
MRKTFFETLGKIAKGDRNIFLLTADLGVKFLDSFRSFDPGRFINIGIAESNMIGVAAGLAMSGKNVYCYSIIPFLIMRTFEQIRIDICYNALNVKLLGSGGGLVYGAEGVTHHAIEDIALMRSLPNMAIVAPGDALEAKAVAEASVNFKRPLYIRFGRDVDPSVHREEGFDFQIGKGIVVNRGNDICLIATGSMLYLAKLVTDSLKDKGLSATLVSMHTIKPLDKRLVEECLRNHRAIFTIEEHNIIGGLGSAVCEVVAESRFKSIFKRIGIQDEYCSDIGKVDYLREKVGLTPENIVNLILGEFHNL